MIYLNDIQEILIKALKKKALENNFGKEKAIC